MGDRIEDMTRLLSLDLDDLAAELGHSSEEAQGIIRGAIEANPPRASDSLISAVSSGARSILEKAQYSEAELREILDGLEGLVHSDEPFLSDISKSGDLFFMDQRGNNILMKMVAEGNVEAVKYLIGSPFDHFHKNNEGLDLFDLIRIFTSKNLTDEEYKERVNRCKEIIYEDLIENPSLKFTLRVINSSPNFIRYEEQYNKMLLATDKYELSQLISDILQKASGLGDLDVVSVLIAINHPDRKQKSAIGNRAVFLK